MGAEIFPSLSVEEPIDPMTFDKNPTLCIRTVWDPCLPESIAGKTYEERGFSDLRFACGTLHPDDAEISSLSGPFEWYANSSTVGLLGDIDQKLDIPWHRLSYKNLHDGTVDFETLQRLTEWDGRRIELIDAILISYTDVEKE